MTRQPSAKAVRCPRCKRGLVLECEFGWWCSRRYAKRNPCAWETGDSGPQPVAPSAQSARLRRGRRDRHDWSAVDAAILRVLRRSQVPLASRTIFARAGVPRLHFDLRLQALKHRGLLAVAYGRTTAARWVARHP